MNNKNKILSVVIICASCIPSIVSADVFISEIMYDQEGTDSKREWIEIYNDGSEIKDFSQYKLFENDVYHGIKEYEGGLTIPGNSYAIIADSPDSILADMPQGAIVFDSAFSLSNSGEVIAVTDGGKNILDEIFYNVELGASGDGNSLQKDRDVWVVDYPTPGSSIVGQVVEKEEVSYLEQSTTQSGAKAKPIVQNPFTIEMIVPEKIIVNEVTLFFARSFNSHGDEINFDNYKWNFGDGSTDIGNNVIHTYTRPGKYIVFVEGKYNYLRDSDKNTVQVESVPISFSVEDKVLEIKNSSVKEFDMTGWTIFVPGSYFKIPQNTFLLPRSSLMLGRREVGFDIGSDAQIMTSSGNFIPIDIPDTYSKDKKVAQKSVTKNVSKVKHNTNIEVKNTALVNDAVFSKKDTKIPWTVLLIISILLGLLVLYFLQKKTNLIDEIEIID
jgi:hypothetical protein